MKFLVYYKLFFGSKVKNKQKKTTQTGLSNRGNILAHINEKSGRGSVSWAEA